MFISNCLSTNAEQWVRSTQFSVCGEPDGEQWVVINWYQAVGGELQIKLWSKFEDPTPQHKCGGFEDQNIEKFKFFINTYLNFEETLQFGDNKVLVTFPF